MSNQQHPPPGPEPDHPHPFCDDIRLDFGRAPAKLRASVFWMTLPMMALDIIFLIVMFCNSCKMRKRS